MQFKRSVYCHVDIVVCAVFFCVANYGVHGPMKTVDISQGCFVSLGVCCVAERQDGDLFSSTCFTQILSTSNHHAAVVHGILYVNVLFVKFLACLFC